MAFIVVAALSVLFNVHCNHGSVLPPPFGLNAFKVGHTDTLLQPPSAVVPVPAPLPVLSAYGPPPSPVVVVPPPVVPSFAAPYPGPPVPSPVAPAVFPEVVPYPGPGPAFAPGPIIADGFYGASFQYPFGFAQRFYGPAAVPSHVEENVRFPGVKVPVPTLPLHKN